MFGEKRVWKKDTYGRGRIWFKELFEEKEKILDQILDQNSQNWRGC